MVALDGVTKSTIGEGMALADQKTGGVLGKTSPLCCHPVSGVTC